jgi:hypothetical protein
MKVVKHLNVFDIDVGVYLNGSTASIADLHFDLSLRRIQDIWEHSKARPSKTAITWKGFIHMHIHRI